MAALITYFVVLAANRKVADLETKIEEIEKEKNEQNHGELLFTIILHSKGDAVGRGLNYQSSGWQIKFQLCQIDEKPSASF